jgi:hypothetical protein
MKRAGGITALALACGTAACSVIVGDGSYRFPAPDATTVGSTDPATDAGTSSIPGQTEADLPDQGASSSPQDGGSPLEDAPAGEAEASNGAAEDASRGTDASRVTDASPATDASRSVDAGGGETGADAAAIDARAGAPDGSVDAGCAPCACDGGVFGPPQLITGFGLDASLFGPALSADGKSLYFGGVINSQEQIYVATRPDDGPMFSQATLVSSVNSQTNDGTPYLSQDGLTLYFYSTRPGGVGSRDLWMAQRANLSSDFTAAVLMAGVNSTSFDDAPWVSADQLTLTFASTRAPSVGGLDVYTATRSSLAQPFSLPTPLGGNAVNSSSNEDRAVMTHDALTVYFASDRGNTRGVYDLWMATRPNVASDFSNAVSLQSVNGGPGQNTTNAFLTVDQTELYFSSDRSGTEQIWRSMLLCP